MSQIMSQLYNTLFNSIYIGILTFIYCYFIYKRNLDRLTKKTNDLTNNQDILNNVIIRLKRIVDIDNNASKEKFNIICNEIDKINNILKINYEEEEKEENKNEDDDEDKIKEKIILPIQNHIKYPDFWIFNEKNFKQTKLQNKNYEFRFTGDDVRLISTQLAQFLNVKNGTCMEFNKAYTMVYHYIQKHNITNISEDPKLCNLFGINENEDYEFTDETIIKALKKMIEPHFRKLIMGDSTSYANI